MTLIEIRTRLNDGIYKSEGGGETRTHYSANAGPLNLLRLARKLGQHLDHMEVCYGNIGCGSSWLRIGDQRVGTFDLPETLLDARQLLAKMALEPEWEARFEPNSFGFRPGRGCHDAIAALYDHIRLVPKFVLDADIAKCFDLSS